VRSGTVLNIFLLILVNTMWAAQYSAYKTASSQMGPVTVSAWTFILSALFLLPFLMRERAKAKGAPKRAWTRRDMNGFFVIGVLGLIPASAFLAWGTDRSTASNASLIYLTVPIVTALLAAIVLGEKMTKMRWVSLGMSLIGVLILSSSDLSQQSLAHKGFLIGNILVLLACASSSFYNVYSKELLGRFSELEVLVYGYLLAVVISIPLLIFVEPVSWAQIRAYTSATWFSVFILSFFSWGLAMVLWMFVLKRIDVSQASVSIYLLPFLGVLISSLTLHEPITGPMILGGLITLAGAILVTATETTAAAA
jgi:drug/metabolite transporter (DMT)-like permease